ncbi:hypothetical protein BJX61DRAFT_542902 [Aspergillus egyptiacus]|nr:hypothetical protein BJX61DRAFT_542902 [Aspergillus egyptiacus]
MESLLFLLAVFSTVAAGQDPGITSEQWLITLNTTIFWPTSTDYFYGPTTGPKATAVSCNAAWIEHAGRSTGLRSLGPTAVTTSLGSYATSEGACRTSISLEKWSNTHTGPLTTLCDGAPRALGTREIVTAYYPGTGPCETSYRTYTNVDTLYREPSPVPECTLQNSDCIAIWSTYYESSSSWRSSIITSVPGDTNSPIRPWDCRTSRTYPSADPCAGCHFLPGTATLFYWPIATASGDLCLQNGTTLPPTGPSTAIVNGETFVSPTVYLSFTSIYAYSNWRGRPGVQCGVDHFNHILSLDPEIVISMRGHRNGKYPIIGTEYPFNFAEFQPHTLGEYTQSLIPWPQYRGGAQCPIPDDNTCFMIRDDYMPNVKLPQEARSIDPNWGNCDLDWYIPPVTMVALDREEITIPPTAEPTGDFRTAAPQAQLASAMPAPTRGW